MMVFHCPVVVVILFFTSIKVSFAAGQ